MYTQRWFSSILIFAFLFLASCTARVEIVQPTTVVSPSTTPSPLFSIDPPIIRPSTTPIPSLTPTITRTPTTTPIPVAFPTPNGILWEYSPNWEWGAWVEWVGGCGSKLIIQNLSKEKLRWELSEQTTSYGDIIHLMVGTFHWSIDGRFLYFVIAVGCADGGPRIFSSYSSLNRLDLNSGEITQLLPSSDTMIGVYPAISSDSKYLAYLDGYKLTIRDLATGEERSITTKLPVLEADENILSTGEIEWSPDNTKLVYGVLTGNVEDDYFDLSLIFVDIVNMKSKLLIEDFAQDIGSVKWLNNEEIRVKAWQEEKDAKITLLINTTTGEISEVNE